MSVNSELRDLYSSNISSLVNMYNALNTANLTSKFVGPYLMYCWENEYLSAKKKILVIGQETNGWYANQIINQTDLDNCIDQYKTFELGNGYNSPFWNYAHSLNQYVNGKDDLNFLATNINKFGIKGCGKAPQVIIEQEKQNFNVFADELKIINPDICVFFSGPDYDCDITDKLPDAKFKSCSNFTTRELARVVSKDLPQASFRTYHPGYLMRSKRNDLWDELLKLVSIK